MSFFTSGDEKKAEQIQKAILENLAKLDKDQVKFITIRRRG